MSEIFIPELMGTAMLILLGGGVVANVLLTKSKGIDGGWLLINFGWGLAVFAGVYVSFSSGAHINPAVTFGIWSSGATEFGSNIPVNGANFALYLVAQMVGAMIGAALVYVVYKRHFDETDDPGAKLAIFSTGPAIRAYGWNIATEVIATFVLVFVVLKFGNWPGDIGPLAVSLLVVGIGASLGGPTGYAINPARDLGPRIMHALLPIKGKGSSDWSYAWVPVVGPIVGGIAAGLLSRIV